MLVHLVLAAGLWWYLKAGPSSIVLAQLDLSSVELSLAEEDVPTAVPVAALPAQSATPVAKPGSEMREPPVPQPDATGLALPALDEPRSPEPPVPELPRMKEFRADSRDRTDPAKAPKQAKIDAPPSPRRAIRPDYPRGARLRKEEGDVVLEIRVSEAGEVEEVHVVSGSGFEELDAAAFRAARAARFTPAKSGDACVASVARLKLTFKLK